MSIVGAVLFVALGFSFYSAYSTQHELTHDMLEQGISEAGQPMAPMGDAFGRDSDEYERGDRFRQLTLVIELDQEGNVCWSNVSSLSLDDDALSSVLKSAAYNANDTGERRDLALAWMRTNLANGHLRVAIVDIGTRDEVLTNQLVTDLVIFAGTMLVLFVIVRRLAEWVLHPVEDAWEKQRTFISDASHELKTPLSVIIANTQILQSDKGIPRESARWIDSTADEAIHMSELVNELLELARADESTSLSSTSAMVREDCDLSELVNGAVLEFDAVAYERGCEISASVENGVVLSCDRQWIDRAVRVFLDNATKYATVGSVVKAELSSTSQGVRFAVTNQGQVIDAEDLAHVFDRFYRTDKARSRESSGGFGLGLAIAKSIVEAHGGKVMATSDAKNGTTFSFVI